MRSRRLLVLFATALFALGTYLLVLLPRQHAADREQQDASQLFDFDPRTVDHIQLDRSDDTLRFALIGTHWTMQAPLHDDAELGAVFPMVVNLATAQIQRDLGVVSHLERFGLAPPSMKLRLFAGADTVAVLCIGDANVDRSAVYARRNADGPVLLLPTSLRHAASLPLSDYRNQRVVVFDIAAVEGYRLHTRLAGDSEWWRGSGDAWFTVVDGDTVAGDSVAVPAVLHRLRGMRVRTFPAHPDTSQPAVAGVTMHKSDGSTQWVRFFHSHQGWLATTTATPRVVQVDDNSGDIAHQSLATLRDRRVLQFDPLAAQRMTVTTPDTSAVLVRAGGRWALPNPALGSVDPLRVADLVRALRALRFERLWPDAPLDPRRDPVFSLVIRNDGDSIMDELQCAPAPGDTSWVAYSQSLAGACEIPAGAVRDLAVLVTRLRR